jgi:two-component system response regulator HydG
MLFSDFFSGKIKSGVKQYPGIFIWSDGYFQNSRWPGNLRELQNCIKSILTQGDFVEKAALPLNFQNEESNTDFSLSENEKKLLWKL